MRKVMIDKIGEAAMYEQLAEECCELAQAALKRSRELRGDNLPRCSHEEVMAHLEEEVADVWLCIRELDLKIDGSIVMQKEERFLKGWEKFQNEHEH